MFSKGPFSLLLNAHFNLCPMRIFCLSAYDQTTNGNADGVASRATQERNERSLAVRYFQFKSFPDPSYALL